MIEKKKKEKSICVGKQIEDVINFFFCQILGKTILKVYSDIGRCMDWFNVSPVFYRYVIFFSKKKKKKINIMKRKI